MRDNFLKRIFVTLILVLVFIFFDSIVLNHGISGWVYKIFATPFGEGQKTFYNAQDYVVTLRDIPNLLVENDKLRANEAKYIGQEAIIEKLEKENQRLKTQLSVKEIPDHSLTEAEIIQVERTGLVSSVRINRGKNHGIEKDMPVILAGNVLIGVISDVFSDNSRVTLVDDTHFSASVRFVATDIVGTVKGGLDGSFRVELVVADDVLPDDAVVVTSGLDELPSFLVIGRITEKKTNAGSLFQSIKGKILFEPSLGPEVYIITK